MKAWIVILFVFFSTLTEAQWNDPYPPYDRTANYRYSTFTEPPKTLDPARSYIATEYLIIGQIYEPPLQYAYLKRPYQVEPLTAESIPTVEFFNAENQKVDGNSLSVAYTIYTIKIKPKIYYAPHPAFAKDAKGQPYYLNLDRHFWRHHPYKRMADFPQVATRELTAADYIYEIKRLAHPQVQSPILGLMSEHIEGLGEYAKFLQTQYRHGKYLDLRQYDFSGVKEIDRYTYQVKIRGKYPQFMYWLTMLFFSPMPWEADFFHSQAGMAERNLILDWYAVGTGPYQLIENNPNREMILAKNIFFHPETYPTEGEPGDREKGYLEDAGKKLPMIDRLVMILEKESIPTWTKFLQGYYDAAVITSDNFGQAVTFTKAGNPELTAGMKDKDLRLVSEVSSSIMYFGFNMLDPLVGGYTERAKKLRQAISILLDMDEYITIFLNDQGVPAQGPLAPGIFGYRPGKEGINPIVYDWINGRIKRKPISAAKQLLAEAGYPGGIDPKTKQNLVIHFDTISQSGPDDKARLDWMRKQFARGGLELQIRATQYNRFQQIVRNGQAQMYNWGWNADYPDPENFLFLLYGPNGKSKFGGENASNYENSEFDRLFLQMKSMDNTPERQKLIDQMIQVVREDAPWIWGYYAKSFMVTHQWNRPNKLNFVAQNGLKYVRLNPDLRAQKRTEWNQPILWPFVIIFGVLVFGFLPVAVQYYRKEHYRR